MLFFAIVLSVFICPLNMSKEGELMEVGLDWQVALKLAVSAFSAMLGLWGVLTTTGVRRVLLSIPACILILILLLAFPSALSGFSPSALPATLINLSYVAFIATCLAYLKEKTFFYAIVLGTLAACGFAWILYFLMPEFGVFKEFLGSVTVERLGGHAHPNSVGRTAAIGLLASAALWRDRRISTPIAFWLVLAFSVTIAFTISRTVIGGTGIALAALFMDRLKTRAGIQWMMLGGFVGLLALFLLIASGNEGDTIAKLAGSVSKTGDSTELTTGTGRVAIWAEAIRLISEKPITGYGFGAAQALMLDFSQSTHNMFLHAAMVAGVVAGALMICLALWLVNVAFAGEFRPISALAIFVLISGLFEDTVLETFPGPATLSFFVCCLCPLRRHENAQDTIVDSDEDDDLPLEEDHDYDRPRQPR
ncbi:O-Antigen ligase [Planctomycetes bacterium K23_9]|uniref:O-Antigen ligase n=2 Tax=Stieleria marina TaxID=1930275 RepID=A0A517NZP8_9BACT|nr:O-Antigen ligase [Planctomycetes bacterium K23_9]